MRLRFQLTLPTSAASQRVPAYESVVEWAKAHRVDEGCCDGPSCAFARAVRLRRMTAWAKAHEGPCKQPSSARCAFAHPTSDPGRSKFARAARWLVAPVYLAVAAAAMAAERAQQLQPNTEDLQRRSACAALGQQILEGNFIRSAVYQDQFSRYSPRTNRCYVEMRVQTINPDDHSERFARYLYDGQTKEMLAFAQIQNGKKSGKVFDLHHRTMSFENAGWDDASQYIYDMMAGERR